MDPINIIVGLNLIATFGANIPGAKKGLRSTITSYREKPKTYLQKVPLSVSVLSLIAFILGIFQIGTLPYNPEIFSVRVLGAAFYIVFSWLQISAFKKLGEFYSQDIIIFKNHRLVKSGIYKYIRHPQYFFQILLDLGAAAATMSYLVLILWLFQIPLLFLRAKTEEHLLQKYFKDEFSSYKKKSGFFIPFIG